MIETIANLAFNTVLMLVYSYIMLCQIYYTKTLIKHRNDIIVTVRKNDDDIPIFVTRTIAKELGYTQFMKILISLNLVLFIRNIIIIVFEFEKGTFVGMVLSFITTYCVVNLWNTFSRRF